MKNLTPPLRTTKILALTGFLASLALMADPAQAANFSFSFSNVEGLTPGTVAGTIVLGDGNGTFAATAITITSTPATLGYTDPIDVFSYFNNVSVNNFVVSNGQIDFTNSSFAAVNSTFSSIFALNYDSPSFGSLLTVKDNDNTSSGVLDQNNKTLASAVPEPLTILGAMTAAGFGAGFKRKLAKAQKDKKDA